MTRLHTVSVRHCAPKDTHDAIEALVIADDEAILRDRIDREFNYERWKERQEDGETWTVYPDDGTGEHEEGVLERMLRLRGDVNDGENDGLYSDLYYGQTLYGWDVGREVTDAQIQVLLALGIVQDWREPAEGPVIAAEAPPPSLTALEAAKRLDGSAYGSEGSKELFAAMKAAGLVAVFGYSDDGVELRGAIDDELGIGRFHVTPEGLLKNECDDDACPHFKRRQAGTATIEPVEGAEGFVWTYRTTIPHRTFIVRDDGDLYCRGIVFALADVPSPIGA